jgi:ferrous iron transport protein B
LPLVVLALGGALVSRIAISPDDAAFIMELPLYHVPNARTIGLLVWERTLAFLKKAGTVILFVSILVWLLATLPHGEIETSYLAVAGQFLAPVGSLMGLDWRPLVALLTSFVAKENSVATLGILYGVGEDAGALASVLRANLSAASGLAFLVAQMLFIPCVPSVAAVRQETASWRWALVNVAVLALLAILGGAAAYRLALLVM